MANFIPKKPSPEVTSGDVSVSVDGSFVSLSGDEEVFGTKDFVDNVVIRGDLLVSGDTRVTQITDFTSADGDINGFVFRGNTGFFDEIVVGNLVGADDGGDGSSGESSGGMNSGPVFVRNVSAVGGVEEILESDFGGLVVRRIRTAEAEVDVSLLVERGDAQTFKPSIEYFVSGDPSILVQVGESSLNVSSNGYSFDLSLRLDSSSERTYFFKNGARQTSLVIERGELPVVLSASFIDQPSGSIYPNASFSSHGGSQTMTQTEVKNGDLVKLQITASKPIQKVIVLQSGALSGSTLNGVTSSDNGDGTFSVEVDAYVGGASNSPNSEGFSVRVEDAAGNQSDSYLSDNQIATNNSPPSSSVNATYPAGQRAIDNSGEIVQVALAPTGVDFYNFSFSSSLLQLTSPSSDIYSEPFGFSGGSSSTYKTGRVTFQLFKSSNGQTATAQSPVIKMQPLEEVPGLSLSQQVFRSSPGNGLTHSFVITPNQPLESMSIVSLSELSIALGSLSKSSDTSFSFSISVTDDVPRGGFDFTFNTTKLQNESLDVVKSGDVRGFTSRVVRVFATDYEAESIGAEVVNYSKLNISVQPVGGSAFSVPYDPSITGPKQDGASNLAGAVGVMSGTAVVVDNQVITNASNINDVDVTVEEVL
jgi:hypothetical protein